LGFFIPAFVDVLISGIFIYVGFKINEGIDRVRQRKADKFLDQEAVSKSMSEKTKDTDQSLQDAKRNMWVVILWLSVINMYSFLYTLVLLCLPDDECHLDIPWLYNLSTIFERFVTLILWTFPIIFVFWPKNRYYTGCLKKEFTAG
jgi:hypothetical protein